MALIDTILSQIINAKYGRDVRQAIHDGIQQCYADAIVGVKGDQGISITSVTRTSGNGAEGTIDVYTVAFSNNTSSTFQVRHGSKGSTGATGEKGEKGDPGLSIQSIVRTSGTGAEGTVDTYTITLTNGATQNFSIRNGSKGSTGLTGATGPKGDPGVSITNIVRTSGTGEEGTTDIYTIYLSSGASQTFTVKHGSRGPTGATGVGIRDVRKISGTGDEGTVDTYAVMLSSGENKNFDVRHGSKGSTGSKGDPGKGVAGINKVSGTGAPGSVDTYAISYTDGSVTNFNVYNGADGAGSPTAQKLANARALTIGAVSKLFDGSEDVTWSLEELDLAQRLHTHTTFQITDFPTEMPASDVYPWAKSQTKPVYTPIEVGAASEFHEHTTSDITNFPASMPASDVEAWAKALAKPSYTPAEVGAAPVLHNHTTGSITDFPETMPPSPHAHSKDDITDFPTEMPPEAHNHGNITSDGKIGTSADNFLVTGADGIVEAKDIPSVIGLVGFTSVGLDFTGDTGDARGTNAIDLQKERVTSDRVAAADGSFIAGGYSNKVANWVERDSDAMYGHAEGYNNTVYEWYGHAEGCNSINDGKISHTEGNSQICSANDSHCEGDQNICGRKYFYDRTGSEPIVTGSEDAGDGLGVLQYIVVPDAEGDVTSYFPNALTDNIEARYGAGFTKDIRGNIYSTVYGGTQATWDGETLLTAGTLRWAMHPFCVLHGSGEGQNILVRIARAVYASGSGTKVYYYGAKPYTVLVGISSSYSPTVLGGGRGQHAEGTRTSTWGNASHAEGFNTRAWSGYSHSEGYKTQALKRSSHAEGEETISNGLYAHAEGRLTQANGQASHAEGDTTVAAGASSHAEGSSSQANGLAAHAEGYSTQAIGQASHAQGLESQANRNYQNSYSAGKLAVIGDNQVSSIMYSKACAGVGWHDISVIRPTADGRAYNFETMVIGRQIAGTGEAIGNTFAYKFTGAFIAGSGGITLIGTPVRTLVGRSAGMSGDGLTTGVRMTWYGYYANIAGVCLKYDGVADTTFQVSSYTTWQEMGLLA